MKKCYSLVAIIGIFVLSNCSKIEENNDPVLGIWAKTSTAQDAEGKTEVLNKEWIFNDAYMGRYHEIKKGVIVTVNDFRWSVQEGRYTIVYPNLGKDDDIAFLKKTETGERLVSVNGEVLAIRE